MSFVTPPAHEIVTATIPEEIQQCLHVRIEVFVNEQRFSLNDEIDQYDSDPTATHILLRLIPSLTPIGTIRGNRFDKDECYYKLSRLAVLQPYRQYKFGRALVDALHNYIKTDAKRHVGSDASTVKVIAHSQIPVKGFYAKFGYIPKGPEFDEDGDPHQKMVLQLPLE
ncbi:gnat family [Moniliophthora roreri]|nr:gnat family [Moniliophthora roreri]